ncbi:cytochrome P450 [Hygrophoropsis aurantiaca]|uniref:Cytochrome P450 n=1 Tax=Hygrophoropsis aurantiaca TaxID=72124 RepID=A0ACB8A3D2_9AGAM|nr:cytochrome P450 [Hygrophoropsis aurantiaca]
MFPAIPSDGQVILSQLKSLRAVDILVVSSVTWALLKLIRTTRRRLRSTKLRGPPNQSFVFGLGKVLQRAEDPGAVYEQWAREYGPVYKVPSALGKTRVVLCDPKAIAHFFARETYTYVLTPLSQNLTELIAGRGLSWSQGDSHKRQRKLLTPAFSNAAIRGLTTVFYDSAYKAKVAWDNILESSSDSSIIEVQSWMNHISLDTIGISGFSHDFGALDGKRSTVADVFASFGNAKPSPLAIAFFLLAPIFPWLVKLPTARIRLARKLCESMGQISEVLLARTRQEKESNLDGGQEDKSIIGLLIKAGADDAELRLTPEEVLAQVWQYPFICLLQYFRGCYVQMRLLLLAGYETTSTILTWALINLSQNPEKQARLREELLQFSNTDPTWDQLNSSLPYLDAVVHEVLRLHPPVREWTRIAAEDDVIPLGEPIQTASGKLVDHISVAKGAMVSIPMLSINRSEAFWGADAKEFKPERWLDEAGITGKAKELQGHRHLLTFVDGARTCLGKGFALAEIKAVLSVLIRNFAFELRDGPDTKVELTRGVLSRPKIAGEAGYDVPLKVRRLN